MAVLNGVGCEARGCKERLVRDGKQPTGWMEQAGWKWIAIGNCRRIWLCPKHLKVVYDLLGRPALTVVGDE